ncbi:MAG: ATPase, T2SS/T4P/T4SS family [bacterium]
MALLQIKSGAPADMGRKLPLDPKQPITIGRAPGNAMVLADNKVSRQHADVRAGNGGFVIVDKGSSFGTIINGRKIDTPVALKHGDEIMFGTTCVVFLTDESAPLPASPPQQARPAPAAQARPAPAAPPVPAGKAEDSDDIFAAQEVLYTEEMMVLKRKIHEQILTKLQLPQIASTQEVDDELKAKLESALDPVLREFKHELPSGIPLPTLRQSIMDELIGFGPISPLLNDPTISEVMVNGPTKVFIERQGKLKETKIRFFDNRHLITIIQRITEPLGRRIDEASPMVDARLPDGSRVNAIIPPLALDGPSLTIRKFAQKKLTTDDLIGYGSMTKPMADFLSEAVRTRQNCVVSGGTGSGKTTLLNILSQFIPQGERIVTMEDSAELKLTHRNLVRLESRPPNIEGRGRIAIRDLVINALRMRPDRIVVGECRGAEALDMLQAMNTGHDGSLTTIHANTPRDCLMRLENLVMMAGFELPSVVIREQIASAVNIVVQQSRLVDGTRKITYVSEITGREGNTILMQDIFVYEQTGFAAGGKVEGHFKATGNIPRFIEELRTKGDLRIDMSIFK